MGGGKGSAVLTDSGIRILSRQLGRADRRGKLGGGGEGVLHILALTLR
jgi:hypothetical protein